MVICLKVAAGITVYIGTVLLIARACALNTIQEENEQR
jgi:hypothetical protein